MSAGRRWREGSELEAEARADPDRGQIEGDGERAGQSEGGPEADASAEHGGKDEEQGQRGQDEPEGRDRQRRHPRRIAGVAPQPDEREQRNQWQRHDQPAPPGPAPRHLRRRRDDQAGDERLEEEIGHRIEVVLRSGRGGKMSRGGARTRLAGRRGGGGGRGIAPRIGSAGSGAEARRSLGFSKLSP